MAFISLDSFISSKTNIKFKVYEPAYRMGPVVSVVISVLKMDSIYYN